MMSTRAAAFAGKISNLRESILRIQNGTMPQPTCIDLANMMKYFSQVLQDFKDFKDIENIPLYASEKKEQIELIKQLPNFDYCGLYKTLSQLVDILPLIPSSANGLDIFGSSLLMLFKCLVPFLEQPYMETMPCLVATLFMSLPQSLHKDILDTICFNLLPFIIDQQQNQTAKFFGHKAKSLNLKKGSSANRRSSQRSKPSRQSSMKRPIDASGFSMDTRPSHCIVRIEDHESSLMQRGDSNNQTGRRRPTLARSSAGDSLEDQGIEIDADEEPAKFIDSNDEDDDDANNQHDHGYDGDDAGLQIDSDDEEYGMLSVTSILLIAFHYINEPMHHSQMIESLMKLKSNVFEDLIFVIAYGTTRAKCPAVELLFRYWPDLCPSQQDRKNNNKSNKLKHVSWQHTKCQNKDCKFSTSGENEAVKMCLDFKISMMMSDLPPPMLICLDCVDSIYKDQFSKQHEPRELDTKSALGNNFNNNNRVVTSLHHLDEYNNKVIDILLPMDRVSKLCENKKCKSLDKKAIGTCFDIECANYNCKKPIRYCRECFVKNHTPSETNGFDVTLQTHIRHSSMNLSIMETDENINNFVEAIISLLKEASPADRPSKDSERYLRSMASPTSQFPNDTKGDHSGNIATEERQLISQYGIWLMTGLLEKVDKIKDDLLGRLLGMLFQWFHFTACLPDDQAGSALEKLKGECIKGWILGVKNQRLDVFISCLLPHPIDCSKIGGHWEVWPDTAHQIKEGFKRLLCLVPYDIITDDVWDEIMPYWMECFRHEVPENELSELKILLSKVFDPELSPLGFETKQMYNFISSRFEDITNLNQEQTLYWLQIITMLEIPIPIDFLFQMLKSGVKSLAQIRSQQLDKLKNSLHNLKRQRSTTSNKLPSGNGNQGASDDDDSDDTDDSSSESGRSGSGRGSNSVLSEDNVLVSADKLAMSSDERVNPLERALASQKERQANARAAFSAKIMQQASILDGRATTNTSIGSGPNLSSLSSIPASPSMQSTVIVSGGNLQPRTNMQHIPTLASNHSQPLKSTTSSLSDSNQHQNKQQITKSSSHSKKKTRIDEPKKLKIKLSSSDEDQIMNRVDNNLVCYILMMDITLKQLNLQEINSHKGLDAREAQQAIELLNTMVATPWIGKHTCCDTLPECTTSSATLKAQQKVASEQQSDQQQDVGNLTTDADELKRKQQLETDNAVSANIHAYSHCASGFEDDDTLETCVFCEIISTFHQLSLCLIEYFSPIIEVSICEIPQDAANGEFDGKPDYSRIGLNHLSAEPLGLTTRQSQHARNQHHNHSNFNFDQQHLDASLSQMNESTRQQYNLYTQFQNIPSTPYSPTYYGPSLRPEVLSSLPNEIQLTYNLLVQFHQYQTPDIVSQLLQMIKLISLHSQVLSKASKNSPQFIVWCQHNMLIGKLWSLCELESSEIARTCVPLLLHCITLPWGVRLIRDLLESDFNSDNWLQRFRAVERVVTIAQFSESSTIKNSTLLQSTMASAFCYVVRCLDDIEAIVAQRALNSLEMMKTSSLKLLLWCLEVQFDYIVIDRPIILKSVFQLYNHLSDRRFLTWEFFLNRFDTVFMEAQIYLQQSGEIPSFAMQDLKNTNTKSEIYQRKIIRAKEALQEIHHSRSLSIRFSDKKHTSKTAEDKTPGGGHNDDTDSDRYKHSLKLQRLHHAESQPVSSTTNPNPSGLGGNRNKFHMHASPLKRILQHGKSTSSRYQTIAYLISQSQVNRKNSKFMVNLAIQSVPPSMMLPDKLHQHLPNAFVDDGSKLNEIAQENHVFGIVHRICDEDRDTNHLLIFLLMQFFSKKDPSHPSSAKTLNRIHQIVLRHLNILMGYSIARRSFLISAANLRLLPVFNAFLTSLPKLLDFNYQLGTILLDTCLPVLVYCPAPDDTPTPDGSRMPTYSLWLLNPLARHSWLMSVLTFLYKYQFGQPHLKDHVQMLMWIVINTLESHLNCRTLELTLDKYLVSINREPSAQRQDNLEDVAAGDKISNELSSHKDDQQKVNWESPGKQSTTTSTMDNNEKDKQEPMGNESQPATEQTINQSTSGAILIKSSTEITTPRDQQIQPSEAVSIKADSSDDSANLKKHDSSQKSGKSSQSADDQNNLVSTVTNQQDERLLPIGLDNRHQIHSQGKGSAQEIAKERLLPIGKSFSPPPQPILQTQGTLLGAPLKDDNQDMKHQQLAGSKHPLESETNRIGAPVATHITELSVPEPQSIVSSPPSGQTASKPNKRRFGPSMGNKHQTSGFEMSTSGFSSKQQQLLGASGPMNVQSELNFGKDTSSDLNRNNANPPDDMTPPTGSSNKSSYATNFDQTNNNNQNNNKKKNKWGAKFTGKDYVPKVGGPILPPSFSSPSLLNEQLAQINRHSLVEEFSDKDLSMCLIILETFIHHEPSLAAQMLPNILRLVARYSSANQESWQTGSNVHLVGGSMFVARQFIRVALHDLMENNIFQQIFTSHFTGYDFYKSMATALADFPDLNQLTPLSKLFEDLNKQKNLPALEPLVTMLENVATYFECILTDSTNYSQTSWTNLITNWENFLRKLILALPRYSGTSSTQTTGGSTSGVGTSHHQKLDTAASIIHAGTGAGLVNAPANSTPSKNMPQLFAAVGSPASLINSSGGISGAIGASSLPGVAAGVGPSLAATTNSKNNNNQQEAAGSANQVGGATDVVGGAQALPPACSMIMQPIIRIIVSTTKVSQLASCRTIVDPYSKIICYTVLNTPFKYEHLLEISNNCSRIYTRDREKYLIQRTIAYELIQVIKFRFFILEKNLLMLLLFILHDVGGTLPPKVLQESLQLDRNALNQAESYVTNISESLRQYIGDILEFITDVHAISRVNDNLIGGTQPSSINRDSFGGYVKAALAQYLALELSPVNASDNRIAQRCMTWLFDPPRDSNQNAPRVQFIDCILHIRQVTWIILGSLQNSALTRGANSTINSGSSLSAGGSRSSPPHSSLQQHHSGNISQPIPIEKTGLIADHVQAILAGFAEQSKESVLHMSGLFHAFLLCQLWTVYCETLCYQHPPMSEQYQICQSSLDDFWSKITPGILRLVEHSRVMSEMVSTHFLQLIESLIESNSSILIRYLPMWNSVFYSYEKRNKSRNLALRLQKCVNWQPPDLTTADQLKDDELDNKRLLNWLEKVQYKMSHIEIQSSQAAPFYLT